MLNAQSDSLSQAIAYVEAKEYTHAEELLKPLLERVPQSEEVYRALYQVYLGQKKYKEAERLVEKQLSYNRNSPLLLVDLGNVYLKNGKEKKAMEYWDNAIAILTGDDMLNQRMANAFVQINRKDYAIKVYERAGEIFRNNYMYSTPLSQLYYESGDLDKAITILLENPYGRVDDIKAILLQYTNKDAKKIQTAQKAIIKQINLKPEMPVYSELLTWIYIQRNDWDGALMQMEALDERLNERGARIINFAQLALREENTETALKALSSVISKGKEEPLYAKALATELEVRMQMLEGTISPDPKQLADLKSRFRQFLSDFPQYNYTSTLRDYAHLMAVYMHQPDTAVRIIEMGINPGATREFVGWCKLDKGDYEILAGKIWDASLSYSQVDKAFREDYLGEEARYRNARLSYYLGDFEWAQTQLTVLKASTSELIANDALELSVLITENIPPDSNLVPLLRFAHTDLLLFQNKYAEAEQLLDSIYTTFPQHPLRDDILMRRALIAEKKADFQKALDYYALVLKSYKNDVLADDALYKSALIYHKQLKNDKKAMELLESLILDFPGSTYTQNARALLAQLKEKEPAM